MGDAQGRWFRRAGARDALVVGAAFAASLAVYVLTVAPTVLGRDTGEFITATWVLGVVHPTGYPLYMLLGKAFELLIPFGEVALRLNLASAVFGAGAAGLVAFTYLRCGGGCIGALLAALSASFVWLVWSQALIADKYALNGLLVAATLAAFAVWFKRRTPRSLVALCALAGLATIAHHRTAGLAVGPFVVAAVALHRPFSAKVLAKAGGAFLAGFAWYLYFPIRSAAFPPAAWTNLVTWGSMQRFLAGSDWAEFVFHRRGAEMWDFIGVNAAVLRRDVTLAGLALAVVGWGVLAARSRVLWICSTLGFVLTGAWAATYDVWNAAVYFLPCYLFFGMWLAVGVEAIARLAARIPRSPGARPAVARALVAAALVAIPAKELVASWSEVSQRRIWGVRERGEVMLANTPRDARMVIRGHASYTTPLYLTLVVGERPDMLLASSGLLGNLWYQVGIPDRPLRLAAEDTLIAALHREITDPEEFSPYLVRRLLGHVADARPLVTNFAVADLPRGLWEKRLPDNMIQITDEAPPAPEPGPVRGKGAASFPLGLELVESAVRPARLHPGGIFTLDLQWRPTLAVEQPMLVVATLVPRSRAAPGGRSARSGQATPPGQAADAAESESEALIRPAMEFEFPLEYGAMPLAALPAGRVYRQSVKLIATRALPAGPCALRLRVISGISSPPPTAIATLEIVPEGR